MPQYQEKRDNSAKKGTGRKSVTETGKKIITVTADLDFIQGLKPFGEDKQRVSFKLYLNSKRRDKNDPDFIIWSFPYDPNWKSKKQTQTDDFDDEPQIQASVVKKQEVQEARHKYNNTYDDDIEF